MLSTSALFTKTSGEMIQMNCCIFQIDCKLRHGVDALQLYDNVAIFTNCYTRQLWYIVNCHYRFAALKG